MAETLQEKMRREWNERARADAYYYVASARRHQDKTEFLATAAVGAGPVSSVLDRIRSATDPKARKALEIGCGPGRLMLALAGLFAEIHGIDVSDEMISLARSHLRDVASARLHLGSGTDLAPLPDGCFDLVYSYAVFQHIPSKAVVSRYLEEGVRVLRPGGVLCCQLRGAPSPPGSTAGESETWLGCVYPSGDVVSLFRRLGMSLLEITGAGTQHLWIVARKPLGPRHEGAGFAGARLNAITPAGNPFGVISPSGPGAAFQCWLAGFPEWTSLEDFEVEMGDSLAVPCYISEHLGGGGFQLNVPVPRSTPCGSVRVRLLWRGQPVAGEQTVDVREYPEPTPAIVDVTDGTELLAKYASTTGSLKVTLSGIPEPAKVSFRVDSRPVEAKTCQLLISHLLVYEFTLEAEEMQSAGPHALTVATPNWSETVPFSAEPQG